MRFNVTLNRYRLLPVVSWVLGLLILWEAGLWFMLQVLQVPMAQSKSFR